jgi:hypothetical protein
VLRIVAVQGNRAITRVVVTRCATERRISRVSGYVLNVMPEPVTVVAVETASDDPREARTAAELRELLTSHGLAGLQWTARVKIEHWVVPHSHPVLTLNTRNHGDELLAAYLHEQLHWWTANLPAFGPAIDDTRQVWPTVRLAEEGGADGEHSTRLHLIVCHLEWRAMQHVVGPQRASAVLRRQIDGRVYPWVYDQVHSHERALDRLCTDRGLWPDRLTPGR